MINSKIRDLMSLRKLTLDEVSNLIEMSRTGLHNAIKANDFKVTTLNKIANVLDVPISYFFDETTEANDNMNNITIGDNNINSKVIIAKKYTDTQIEKLKFEVDILRKQNEQLLKYNDFLQNLINGGKKQAVFFDKQQ